MCSDPVQPMGSISVVEPGYAELKSRGYQLKRLIVSGKCEVPSSKLPDIHMSFEVVDPDFHYSAVYQNDIACIFNPRVNADTDSLRKIDFFVPINLLATAKDYESQFSVCDFVAFPGIPEWYDKLEQRPILRSGTIASDPIPGTTISTCQNTRENAWHTKPSPTEAHPEALCLPWNMAQSPAQAFRFQDSEN